MDYKINTTKKESAVVETESSFVKGEAKRPYALIGALVVTGIAVVFVLAYLGVVGLGLFSVQSSLFGLGFITLSLAFGLSYVLFTLRASLRDMRYEQKVLHSRMSTLDTGTAPTRPRPASEAVIVRSNGNGHSNASTPYADRRGEHAARTRELPAIEIEGIGTEYGARLKKNGIHTVGQVKSSDANVMAPKIGCPLVTYRQWQSMADLMEVKGIGKQYSELLVRSGLSSVDHLAGRESDELCSQVRATEKTNMQGTPRLVAIQATRITPEITQNWISEAKQIA